MMVTIVENNLSDILLTSAEPTVQINASILGSVSKSVSQPQNAQDIEHLPRTDDFQLTRNGQSESCTGFNNISEKDSEHSHEKATNQNGTFVHTNDSLPIDQTEDRNIKTRFVTIWDPDTESDDDISPGPQTLNIGKRLFQSDVSDDETESTRENPENVSNESPIDLENVPTKKLTGHEAHLQRQEIHSESQRMLREGRVSLPYHKPKQRSLKEFLQRRPKIVDQMTIKLTGLSVVNAIKQASDKAEELSKCFEAREKKVEAFYQSGSESEDVQENEQPINNPEVEITIRTSPSTANEKTIIEQNNLLARIDSGGNIANDETTDTLNNNIDPIDQSPSICLKDLILEYTKDIVQFKNQLLKSFLQPSRLGSKTDGFEDQDVDVELISGSELNKLIDTLNEEPSKVLEGATRSKAFSMLNENNQSSETDISIVQLSRASKNVSDKSNMMNNDIVELVDNQVLETCTNNKSVGKSWKDGKCFDMLFESDDEPAEKINKCSQNNTKEIVMNFKPRLIGAPDQLINLDDEKPVRNGVNTLLKRYLQHNVRKSTGKKSDMSDQTTDNITTVGESNPLIEDLRAESSMKQDQERPGAKFSRFKQNLQNKIKQLRSEEWARKSLEKSVDVTDEEDEEEYYYDKNKVDEEHEESNMNGNKFLAYDGNDEHEADNEDEDDADETEDEFNREDSVNKEARSITKSAFIEDEAEVSENEEDDDDGSETSSAEEECVENNEKLKRKRRSRIKSIDHCDSESETDGLMKNRQISENPTIDSTISLQPSCSYEHSDKRNGFEDEDFPLCQPDLLSTPKKSPPITLVDSAGNNLISPVFGLTALQNSFESPSVCHFIVDSEKSPVPTPVLLKQRLFPSNQPLCEIDVPNTQENISQLMGLCSGKFTSDSHENIITQNLTNNESNTLFKGELLESDPLEITNCQPLISDFETNDHKNKDFQMAEFEIYSSDDDVNITKVTNKRMKSKKKRKLVYVSDESVNSDETNEFTDFEEDYDNVHNVDGPNVVDYDSEENEILSTSRKVRARDFFEAEAELSEDDEQGSADEIEDDLDEMDREAGDDDKFNERELQRTLGKIHLRQILDTDKRQVRMLQEQFLPDGELHSENGRQRRFRWLNADRFTKDENVGSRNADSGQENSDNDETEERWRTLRHERETFLRERRKNMNLSEEMGDMVDENERIILRQEILRTDISICTSRNQVLRMDNTISSKFSNNAKMSLGIGIHKRGSFLGRSETTLTRLANLTKSTNEVVGGAKSSHSLLFKTVNLQDIHNEKMPSEKPKAKKRKFGTNETSTVFLKKLRLSEMSK